MGQLLAKISQLPKGIDARIVMVGLGAAGQTTVLFKLKLNDVVATIPTIGFSVRRAECKNLKMTIWDIGGQDRLRPLWRHYYEGTDGVNFVVDSCDKQRMPTARAEIEKMMAEPVPGRAKLCVFANKQDMPNALPGTELADLLGLRNIKAERHPQPTSATTGGTGLDWPAGRLK